MKKVILACVLFFSFTRFGCSVPAELKILETKYYQFSVPHLAEIRNNQFDNFEPVLVPWLKDNLSREQFSGLAAQFPKDSPPLELLIVGCNVMHQGDSITANTLFQYKFEHQYLLVSLYLVERNNEIKIGGIHFGSAKESLAAQHVFDLTDKTFFHYVFLVIAIINPFFILFTFAAILMTKMKKKVLWCAFTLFGYSSFTINWATGAIGYKAVSLLILGSSCISGGEYAPWFLSFALPIGAIAFWINRKNLIKKAAPADDKIIIEKEPELP